VGDIKDQNVNTLWQLSHVKNTKYFQIKSVRDGVPVTLIPSENNKQFYASTNLATENEVSYFSICPTDQSGKKFKIVSKM